MKANRSLRIADMVIAAAALAALSACSSKREAAPPPPKASPRVQPSSLPPPPPPRQVGWRDMPVTPGTWRWRMEGSRSVARFGNDLMVLSCNRDAGTVTLMRPGSAEGEVAMSILASSGNRTLTGQAIAGPPPVVALTLAARDSVLDAMAFSRGRFAVETAGLPTLYLPSWPEVSRVIEDCR